MVAATAFANRFRFRTGSAMKGLLVFGKHGQLAQAIRQAAPDAQFLCRNECNLEKPEAAAEAIRHLKPAAVINAAAYTNVDQAERESDIAMKINAEAPARMAMASAASGIPFLHVSTEHVFNGAGTRPYHEQDITASINAYGSSKLAGENAIRTAGGHWLILRTSWVFSTTGTNFVKSILQAGRSAEEISVVSDQIGAPTCAADLAQACLNSLTRAKQFGEVYHFAGKGNVSRAGFAREILLQARLPCRVREVTSDTLGSAAVRPKNSRLDCRKIEDRLGITRPCWRSALTRTLKALSDE